MSKCISMHGEYSDCAPDQNFICKRCTALDEDALFAKVARLTAERDEARAALAGARALNDRQRATLAKIRTIVTGHEAALVVTRVLAVLDGES